MKRILIFLAITILLTSCHKEVKFDAAGTFEATEVTVSSEVNGRVLSFKVEEGQLITAGQSVGAIDSMQFYLTKLQLQKNGKAVSSNRPDISSQIAALEVQLQTAKTEKVRIQKLLKANAANAKQLDDVNASIALLEKQMDAQKKALQNSVNSIDAQSSAVDIQIALANDNLKKCRLCAPASGTVLNKYVEQGEFAVIGKPLYRLADLHTMYLRAYATSAQVAKMKVGQKVKVIAEFGDNHNKTYEGEITFISADSEFTPKSIPTDDERADLVYEFKVRVHNDGYLKIGTYGIVQL